MARPVPCGGRRNVQNSQRRNLSLQLIVKRVEVQLRRNERSRARQTAIEVPHHTLVVAPNQVPAGFQTARRTLSGVGVGHPSSRVG